MTRLKFPHPRKRVFVVFFFVAPSHSSSSSVEVERHSRFWQHRPLGSPEYVKPRSPGGPRGLPGRARRLPRARRGDLSWCEGRAEVHGRRRRFGDGELDGERSKRMCGSTPFFFYLLDSSLLLFLSLLHDRKRARCRRCISESTGGKKEKIIARATGMRGRRSRCFLLLCLRPSTSKKKNTTAASSGASSPKPSSRPPTLSVRTASSTRRATPTGTGARGDRLHCGPPTRRAAAGAGPETPTSPG